MIKFIINFILSLFFGSILTLVAMLGSGHFSFKVLAIFTGFYLIVSCFYSDSSFNITSTWNEKFIKIKNAIGYAVGYALMILFFGSMVLIASMELL